MRKLFGSLMTIAGLVAVAAPANAQAFKLGYLDSQRILAETPGAPEVQAALQKEMAGFQAQADAMTDSLNTMVADYQKQSLVMSAEAKTKRQGEIQQKQAAFQLRGQQLDQQLQLRRQQLLEPLMQKIEAAIDEVRKAESMSMVFDRAGANFIVSADTTLDITTKVIAKLKAGAPASPPKAP